MSPVHPVTPSLDTVNEDNADESMDTEWAQGPSDTTLDFDNTSVGNPYDPDFTQKLKKMNVSCGNVPTQHDDEPMVEENEVHTKSGKNPG